MSKYSFTEKKFKNLALEKQHKICSSLLAEIYRKLLKQETTNDLFFRYQSFCSWLHLPIIVCIAENISDRYHEHLRFADLYCKEHSLLPYIKTQDRPPKKEFGEICILLDNLRSAHNVGSIIRTTEALRIGKIYFYKNTPYIDNKKVQKTSMATFPLVSCINTFSLQDLPRPFIGLETVEGAKNLQKFSFPAVCTLILGNEEYGISQKLLRMIDIFVEIPMLGFKNSINVACAYAMSCLQILGSKKN